MKRARILTLLCLLPSSALAELTLVPPPKPAPAKKATPAAPAEAIPPVPPAPAPPPRPEPEPLAGYANGGFFLRDPNDWFVIYPKGRLQVDGYFFLNRDDPPTTGPNSPADRRPRDSLFIRRARAEVSGTLFKYFDFQLDGEFVSIPAAGSFGSVADAFLAFNALGPYFYLQAGQYNAPFTMENRTSNKYIDFLERSAVVRAFAVPTNKENGIMAFGWLPKQAAYYSIGMFNGDGQNFRNRDNNFAVIGRAFVAPFAPWARDRRWIRDVWIGGSLWWQQDANLGGQATPSVSGVAPNDLAAMTTQGGVAFFSSSYGNGADMAGNAIRSHLATNGDTFKWAVEANIPIKKVGARFELVHQSIDLAQYNDSNPMNAAMVRTMVSGGRLAGTGLYAELYGWILGDVSFLATPGLQQAAPLRRYAPTPQPRWGLMVAAKYENISFDVTLPTVAMGMRDPGTGNYQLHVFELGLNAWATKHVRLSANYVLNYIDGDAANVKSNLYYQRAEHELGLRVGLAL